MTTLCLDNHRQSFLAADKSLGSVCPGFAESNAILGGIDDLCKLGKDYLIALTCKLSTSF